MRLTCYLREFREARSLTELSELTGISRAFLSRYERGLQLPPDKDVPRLEQAYGASAHTWYPPNVLLAIQADIDKAAMPC